MKRLLAIALVVSLGGASSAWAEGSLLGTGTRIVRQAAAIEGKAVKPVARAMQAGQPGLETSGMSKRKKIFIALAIGVGFAATAYTIDHKVLDVTPSSLGQRQD